MIEKRLDPISVICQLFEQFVDYRNGVITDEQVKHISGQLGAYFTLFIRCHNLGYEKDGNTYHQEWEKEKKFYAHVVILRSRKVFIALSKEDRIDKIPLTDFVNTSNHDSCWRYGFDEILKAIGGAYDFCYDNPDIPEEHKTDIKDAGIYVEFNTLFGHKILNLVEVKFTNNKDKGQGYYNLTSVKDVSFSVTL